MRGVSVMKVLEDRKIAVFITVVIAVAATFFGVNKSLKNLYRDVEDLFYNGVYLVDQKYTEPAVYAHIEDCARNALGLATLLQDEPELARYAREVIEARRKLYDAKDIASISAEYSKMGISFDSLVNTAQSVNLTEREIEAITQYNASYNGARGAVANSSFHEKTTQYSGSVSLIAKLVAVITPNKPPEKHYFT